MKTEKNSRFPRARVSASSVPVAVVASLCLFHLSAEAALKAVEVSQVTRPSNANTVQLSGISYAGDNLYYAVDDNSKMLCTLSIGIDKSSGALSASAISIGTPIAVSGGSDMEGCAFDPCSGALWISDESGSTIREVCPITGEVLRSAPVPAIMRQYYGNYSLEALTISGDGKTMWTSNEEALKCDGTNSTLTAGCLVRLVKFTRESARDNWTPAGQYAYLTEPIAENSSQYLSGSARNGVSALTALPDGTLLVLERGYRGWGGLADDFKNYIYAVDYSKATDVSDFTSLTNSTFTRVTKTSIWQDMTLKVVNYEGMCLGPMLNDGSCSLLLIADGGNGGNEKIMTLKLTGLTNSSKQIRDIYFDDSEDGTAEPVGGPYRYIDGQTVTATVKSLAGNPYESDLRVQPFWSAPEHGAQGLGATAEFTVMANDRVTWNVVTNDRLPLLATDSFERYAVGTEPSGMAAGWSGDGIVAEASYSPATPPGYPLQNETHTRVLMVDGDALRSYAMLPGDGTRFDTMLRVTRQRADSTLPSPDPATDRLMLFFDLNGQPVLRHLAANGSGIVDTKLSDRVFADGDWVRVSITLESGGGAVWCQTLIDGEPAYTAAGVRAPDDWRSPGSWHRCLPGAGSNSRIASVLFRGTGAVDDLMLAETARAFEFDELSGSARTNGVPKKWLSEQGLPYDVRIDADGDGFSSFDEYLVGTDPWSEAEGDCFRILDAGFLENGQYQMLFLGRRDRADFAVFASDSLDAPVEEWNAEVNRPVASGTGTNRWTSLVAPAGAARFYAPRATLAD